MIVKTEPADFKKRFEIAGSFIVWNNTILLLLRQDNKPEGNTWGVPAGKVHAGENMFETIKREVEEETSISIPASNFRLLSSYFNRYPKYDFIFHLFTTDLYERGKVIINPNEHKDFCWTSPREALKLPLIEDLADLIKEYY